VIEESVRRFIVEELSNDGRSGDITDDYPLLERQVLDSLGIFNLVAYLESEFGIVVQDEDLVPANFGTVADIATFVGAKRAGLQAS
jgi:acyl carrier protein